MIDIGSVKNNDDYRAYLKEKYGDSNPGEKFHVSEEEFMEGLRRGKELQEEPRNK